MDDNQPDQSWPAVLRWVLTVPVVVIALLLIYNTFYVVPFTGRQAAQYREELRRELIRTYNASVVYLNNHPGETVNSTAQLAESGWCESNEVKLKSIRISITGGEIRMLHIKRSKIGRGYSGEGAAIDDGREMQLKLPD